jgi:hypothetical protein
MPFYSGWQEWIERGEERERMKCGGNATGAADIDLA